eukprot:TRINITY_DN165_c0_g1_i1.p1 TRINITY_DN165_c0_g1~~TRINITY_DN165_c0_g1_i1.p1  ORF type:complete len:495 (+),score=113.28 TRINITY_DN165_c0_g1_i1:140-1624(+)
MMVHRILSLLMLFAGANASDRVRELLAEQDQLIARIDALESRRHARAAAAAKEPRRLSASTESRLKARRGQALAEGAEEPRQLATADDVTFCLDAMWLLICGFMVMFMQAGFAFLESGSCRRKNSALVLLKNVVDVSFGTAAWWLLGYGFAYGVTDNPGSFIGEEKFIGNKFAGTSHYRDWFFQWAFAATSATIVSGGVAERMRFPAYVLYSIVMSTLIYPIIVYWTWSGQGYLTNNGYSDFAGSGIVHLTGGIGAFVGAAMLGPRKGRFTVDPVEFLPHDINYIVLGTFFLWFGWYGFNCGSTLGMSDKSTAVKAAMVAMNTTLSAAAGGMTVFITRLRNKTFDLCGMCNGILAGLVACCAGVDNYLSGMAILIGILGALAYEGGTILMEKLKVDDPLDAFAVHGCGGMVGCILRPLLARQGVDGTIFVGMLFGVFMIIVWSGGISLIVFGGLRLMKVLRVDDEEEDEGGDMTMSHSPPKEYTHKAGKKQFEI